MQERQIAQNENISFEEMIERELIKERQIGKQLQNLKISQKSQNLRNLQNSQFEIMKSELQKQQSLQTEELKEFEFLENEILKEDSGDYYNTLEEFNESNGAMSTSGLDRLDTTNEEDFQIDKSLSDSKFMDTQVITKKEESNETKQLESKGFIRNNEIDCVDELVEMYRADMAKEQDTKKEKSSTYNEGLRYYGKQDHVYDGLQASDFPKIEMLDPKRERPKRVLAFCAEDRIFQEDDAPELKYEGIYKSGISLLNASGRRKAERMRRELEKKRELENTAEASDSDSNDWDSNDWNSSSTSLNVKDARLSPEKDLLDSPASLDQYSEMNELDISEMDNHAGEYDGEVKGSSKKKYAESNVKAAWLSPVDDQEGHEKAQVEHWNQEDESSFSAKNVEYASHAGFEMEPKLLSPNSAPKTDLVKKFFSNASGVANSKERKLKSLASSEESQFQPSPVRVKNREQTIVEEPVAREKAPNRNEIVDTKVQELTTQIKHFEKEQRKITKKLANIATERDELQAQKKEFEAYKAKQEENLRKNQKANEKKMKIERRIMERQIKAKQALPDRKDRTQIDALTAQVAKLKIDERARVSKLKSTIDRLRQRITDLENKNTELQESLHAAEQARIKSLEQAKANLALKRENVSYDLSNADSPVKHFPTSNFDQTASWDTSPENEQFSQAQKIDSHVQNFHESEDHDEYDPMRYQYDKTVSTKQPASNNVSRAKSTNSKTNEEPQNDNNAVVRNARGRIEHRYPDGRKTLQYDDNSERVVYPDGTKITTFKNGDTLKIWPDNTSVYNFVQAQVTRTTYPDGTDVIEFPSGQVERHFPDNTLEVTYPDGTITTIDKDGHQIAQFPDGVRGDSYATTVAKHTTTDDKKRSSIVQ